MREQCKHSKGSLHELPETLCCELSPKLCCSGGDGSRPVEARGRRGKEQGGGEGRRKKERQSREGGKESLVMVVPWLKMPGFYCNVYLPNTLVSLFLKPSSPLSISLIPISCHLPTCLPKHSLLQSMDSLNLFLKKKISFALPSLSFHLLSVCNTSSQRTFHISICPLCPTALDIASHCAMPAPSARSVSICPFSPWDWFLSSSTGAAP